VSSCDVLPTDWAVHVAPPSTVRRTVPLDPTAQPCSVSTNDTAWRVTVAPLACGDQFAPPSLV
jgi:hypothetical protein